MANIHNHIHATGATPTHRRKSTHQDPFLTIRIRVISESDLFRFAPSRVIPTSFVGMLQVTFLTDLGLHDGQSACFRVTARGLTVLEVGCPC